MTSLPYSNLSRKPDSSTILRSDMLPVNSLEINVNAPGGDIPTRALNVLWCLFCDHVTC